MVEIYSILQMEKRMPFCCLLMEFNDTEQLEDILRKVPLKFQGPSYTTN